MAKAMHRKALVITRRGLKPKLKEEDIEFL
jgi:hypothetical protein